MIELGSSAVAELRASMKACGLTQITFFDDQLVGFKRRRDGGEYITVEVSVDFSRKKVSLTTVRESAVRNSRDRFKEVDYREADWQTLDEASTLVEKFASELGRKG